MAEDWKDLHTFDLDNVAIASHFEDMRQNYQHIRSPRYAVQTGKLVTPTDVTIWDGGVLSPWTQLSTTYLDQVDIVTSGGRDVLIASNPTFSMNGSGNYVVAGMNWDDVPVYSNAEGLGRAVYNLGFDITLPIFHIIASPLAGEHTLKFYFKALDTTGQVYMKISPKFFLLAMEI